MVRLRFLNQSPHCCFSFSIGSGYQRLIFLNFHSQIRLREIRSDYIPALLRQSADELRKFFYLHKDVLLAI